jgi:hypothetical protein
MRYSRNSVLAGVGFGISLGIMPVLVPIVSPEAAPRAVAVEAAAPEHHCYKMIAFRGPIEVPCEIPPQYLTQSQRECLIGIGVAIIVDVATAGAAVGPTTAAAAIACGVKVLASTGGSDD